MTPTTVLFHEMTLETRRLEAELRDALATMPDAADLVRRVSVSPHPVPLLVFTGQYSSGKSTLIKALTDGAAAVVIDSDVSTDIVTDFDWDGAVRLVDTPGVQAGIRDHDLKAEEAIVTADLVLFAVSVDLFDDLSVRHLAHVADGLGKRDQMIIAVTKASTMEATPGIRAEAISRALGGGSLPPFLEVDALDYLDALELADGEERADLVADSRVLDLRGAINDLASRRGQLSVYRQPFQQIRALANEAAARLVPDGTEQVALQLLARQQMALVTRRERIRTLVEDRLGDFVTECSDHAEVFMGHVELLDDEDPGIREKQVADLTAKLQDRLAGAADDLQTRVSGDIDRQIVDLTAEVKEIEASRQNRLVFDLAETGDPAARSDFSVHGRFAAQANSADGGMPAWLADTAKWSKQFQAMWGAGGGMSDSAGSAGHRIVLEVGHFFGHKFQPWGAVRIANIVGNAAKVATVAIPLVLAAGEVIMEERVRIKAEQARHERRRSFILEITGQAKRIASEVRASVAGSLDEVLEQSYEDISRIRQEILAGLASQTKTGERLQAICLECDRSLALLPLEDAAG